ncbi:MAG TPA: hypothetical protein PKE63_02545 [Lacibacter sp.]|nr:hypothetical protein [Lacibacter sp.]HMO89928.1 hypothetical protein [Lacibacter sp.]HMP86125.1 hypothetical protein [Lacibacter sp.]
MKLSAFIALTQEEKKVVVVQEGVPLAKRGVQNHMVFLFHLTGCYVETWCCRETKEVKDYRVFHDPRHLTPYLDAIPIDHLLFP